MNDLEKIALYNLAVSFSAKKNDPRSYLWAIHVQNGALYATDGHRGIRIKLKSGTFANDDISYCGDSVRDAVTIKRLDLLKVQACNPPKFDRLFINPTTPHGSTHLNLKLLSESVRAFERYSKKPIEITTYADDAAPVIISLSDDIAIIDAHIMPIMQPIKKYEQRGLNNGN